MSKEIRIEKAEPEDAFEILTLQKLAYQSEAALWNDYSIPPLTQTIDEITTEFNNHLFLKMLEETRIVGSVRGLLDAGGTCYVAKVIVHPDCQNKGLGTRLLWAIEDAFPTAKRFELFTSTRSERNLYLYQKMGYRPFQKNAGDTVGEAVNLVYLEKIP